MEMIKAGRLQYPNDGFFFLPIFMQSPPKYNNNKRYRFGMDVKTQGQYDPRNTIANDTNNPGIIALIPRGEVIRNFVYSGALDEIAAHANLSLLTISAEAEMDKMLREKYGNIYPLKEYREKWLVRFQREILDTAHGR